MEPLAGFPASTGLAILVGQPSERGPYVIRVKVPARVRLTPHQHPEDPIYTVMSGVFFTGLGEEFERDKAFPPGIVIVLPGNTPHFHWAKSADISKSYGDRATWPRTSQPADDPRKRD